MTFRTFRRKCKANMVDLNKYWNQANNRRGKLISKKYQDGLSSAEDKELERLQNITKSIEDLICYFNPLKPLDVFIEMVKSRQGDK